MVAVRSRKSGEAGSGEKSKKVFTDGLTKVSRVLESPFAPEGQRGCEASLARGRDKGIGINQEKKFSCSLTIEQVYT